MNSLESVRASPVKPVRRRHSFERQIELLRPCIIALQVHTRILLTMAAFFRNSCCCLMSASRFRSRQTALNQINNRFHRNPSLRDPFLPIDDVLSYHLTHMCSMFTLSYSTSIFTLTENFATAIDLRFGTKHRFHWIRTESLRQIRKLFSYQSSIFQMRSDSLIAEICFEMRITQSIVFRQRTKMFRKSTVQ